MATKYLDNNGLLYVWKKLKDTFVKKTELDEVKTAIPKNVTDLLDAENYALRSSVPTKVENLEDAGDYAKKSEIPHRIDGMEGIEAYAKVASIPKKVVELEDYADFVKKAELTEEVKGLIGNVKSIEFSVVEELPASGEKATIYLVSNAKGNNDAYDEFIWVNEKFEKIGTTSVNLGGYLKATDINSITNEEINALFV